MPTAQAPPLRRSRAVATAVAIAAAMASGLCACEYQYDGGPPADAASRSTPFTDAALPQDPGKNRPVTGADLDQWVAEVLPATKGQLFHSGYGLLDAGATRNETTSQLPSGTYSLTLVCRSTRRVSFTVRNEESVLVDLSLRCGTARVNVVQVGADAVLAVRIESLAPANFAYRVIRI
ncbi:hypothetical protein [Arthrobacter sp. B3I4]|uniref:hypothetical protein n=1 Tax=Arthrobacter sp. B3I4 TaxID=3042267 RepID=UPI002785DDC3|nr:hypothetical protein [Arthrobacter sp. B3I4]MDQ0755220.1 hypothetical protein [Arthrobacter sp. B3I4]